MSRKTIEPNSFAAIRVFASNPFADCAVMLIFDINVSVSVVAKLYKGKKKKKKENERNGKKKSRMLKAGEGEKKQRAWKCENKRVHRLILVRRWRCYYRSGWWPMR